MARGDARRRRAVQDDARAHPVEMRRRVPQRGRRIGEAARPRDALRAALERFHLRGDAAFAIRVGEMRHQRDLADALAGARPLPRRPEALRRIAEPVHAAIHFQLNIDRLRQARHFQHAQLLVRMQRRAQAVAVDHVDIGRTEKAFQQQNRPGPAQFTQLHRFFEVEQSKAVGCAQTGKGTGEAVPIGIGLDDGPDFRSSGRNGGRQRGYWRVQRCESWLRGGAAWEIFVKTLANQELTVRFQCSAARWAVRSRILLVRIQLFS